jgi:undecaprenyl-diphosphatase
MASMATLFSFQYKKWLLLFIGIAFVVSFSRIYVGVHYPSDILGGWIVGFICACVILFIKWEIIRRWPKKKKLSIQELNDNDQILAE